MQDYNKEEVRVEEKYAKAAREILECMGGKDNIASAAHCATRLRLVLKDESLINKDALEEIDLVKGNFNNGGQFQIILGTGIVNKVYAEFIQMANIQEMTKEELKKQAAQKMNPVQKLLKTLADVFVPILPALVASGLLMGINNILTAQGMFVANQSLVEAFPAIKDFAEMVNLFSNAGFTFLPVLIGFSAAKIFGATPILGAVLGAIMIHPDLMNGYGYGQALLDGTVPYWHIFGLSVAKVGYQGTVLPVIAASFCLAFVEKKLRKVVPAMLDNIVTPLLSVLIAGALTFLFIGPVMRGVGDMMTNAVMWLFFDLGPVGGLIYGVTYPLLVITGMHHSLVTAETQILANIGTLGGSPTFAVVAAANCAQGAAALAVTLLMKHDQKMKSMASASGISSFLGITEPAIFGVNLKLRFPFYGALIGGGIGAAYATLMGVLSVSQGPCGVIGVICIRPDCMLQFMVSMAVAIICAFAATMMLGKTIGKKETSASEKPVRTIETEPGCVYAPVQGTAVLHTEIKDETFASGAVGTGVGIIPEKGEVVAPFSGEISMVFDTKHAIGLLSEDGVELLIHVGVNTVELNGKHFRALKKSGDQVKAGEKLLEFDMKAIKAAGYDLTTAVLVSEPEQVEVVKTGKVKELDKILKTSH
ncbi:MAG: PTS transporter subunit EIIC [Lachnospiraceae bacterium]|nr:PTS transporter subunit EIIC [Lachnospiraceae bacterium]MCI9657717.1 PTS transporter subunit EIIC [Lachnospiraceae bacterium]